MDTVTLNKESLSMWQVDNVEWLRYDYKLSPGEKCLDIGSYHREWANKMIEQHGVEVECFEALDNRAAWTFKGRLAFGGNFLYTSIFNDGIKSYYECVDIAEYLNEEIAVCKMNIEGGEYELINYIIERGLIKNIRNLQVQFHLIEGQDCETMYKSIYKQLELTHWPTWKYPFCWENWKRNDN